MQTAPKFRGPANDDPVHQEVQLEQLVRRQMRQMRLTMAVVVVLAVAAGGIGTWAITGSQTSHAAPTYKVSGPLPPAHIANIAESSLKSVVSIRSLKVVRSRGFFGSRSRLAEGQGSGVLLDKKGTIVTNNHVVAGADKLVVTLWDGREVDATVVGTDPATDLAVVKLDKRVKNLHPARMGDSSKLRLGDIVLAVGNPFGLSGSVTMGIVSAKGRANVGIVDYEDFIQTDAAINPGNSGGALINLHGELVGINTAILSRSGGYQGIGFAIPTPMVQQVTKMIADKGTIKRGYLGIALADVNRQTAGHFGISETADGAIVADLEKGGPAAKAGLRRGDLIVAVDGKRVKDGARLRNLIAYSGPGARVELEVLRKGKKKKLRAVLDQLPGRFRR